MLSMYPNPDKPSKRKSGLPTSKEKISLSHTPAIEPGRYVAPFCPMGNYRLRGIHFVQRELREWFRTQLRPAPLKISYSAWYVEGNLSITERSLEFGLIRWMVKWRIIVHATPDYPSGTPEATKVVASGRTDERHRIQKCDIEKYVLPEEKFLVSNLRNERAIRLVWCGYSIPLELDAVHDVLDGCCEHRNNNRKAPFVLWKCHQWLMHMLFSKKVNNDGSRWSWAHTDMVVVRWFLNLRSSVSDWLILTTFHFRSHAWMQMVRNSCGPRIPLNTTCIPQTALTKLPWRRSNEIVDVSASEYRSTMSWKSLLDMSVDGWHGLNLVHHDVSAWSVG